MRTTNLPTSAMAGGMRGDRSREWMVVQPRPSLSTVLLVNLGRATGRLLAWAARHPFTIAALTAIAAVWVLRGPVGVLALVLAVLGLLATWRRYRPASFTRIVVSRWRATWLYRRRWQPAMVTTGLATSLNGREYLPRIRKVVSTLWADRVLVDLLSGQAPEEFEKQTSQLAHTFEAHRIRVVVDRPGRIWLEFTHADPLTATVPALEPAHVPDLAALPIGRREDGSPWVLRLLGTHLLIAGATGSGKGSVLWSLIRAVAPAIRDRSVKVWGIDPKGGMELNSGAGLFDRFAYAHPADMVQLLEDAVALMRERAERLRQAGERTHTPTTAEPLVLVVVDELAALTAYAGDRDLKKRAEAALQLLLSQGRAPGVLVVAAVQDPGKDVIGFRDLFPTRIALRLLEDAQVDMVLGRSARLRGAECDQIPASLPGVGYVVLEGVREPVRVRAAHVTDDDLAQMVRDYTPSSTAADDTPYLHLVEQG
jgi:DNA segregation ATPase FtsK/SpoIIIE, S-DNA-T family